MNALRHGNRAGTQRAHYWQEPPAHWRPRQHTSVTPQGCPTATHTTGSWHCWVPVLHRMEQQSEAVTQKPPGS